MIFEPKNRSSNAMDAAQSPRVQNENQRKVVIPEGEVEVRIDRSCNRRGLHHNSGERNVLPRITADLGNPCIPRRNFNFARLHRHSTPVFRHNSNLVEIQAHRAALTAERELVEAAMGRSNISSARMPRRRCGGDPMGVPPPRQMKSGQPE